MQPFAISVLALNSSCYARIVPRPLAPGKPATTTINPPSAKAEATLNVHAGPIADHSQPLPIAPDIPPAPNEMLEYSA